MKCQKCGHEFEGKFCPECGQPNGEPNSTPNAVGPAAATQPPPAATTYTTSAPKSAVRCPRCGGTNLQAVADVTGKGVSFWKLCFCGLLGLCGAGKTKTSHFWVCSSCGNRFKM